MAHRGLPTRGVDPAGARVSFGGLGAPLPVRVARALGAERAIAVDTTFHAEPEMPDGLIDPVFHDGMVMSRQLALPDRDSADVLIEPRPAPVAEVALNFFPPRSITANQGWMRPPSVAASARMLNRATMRR